ncbi:hypothetical protein QYE76_019876, partial [Lolium multiflorum]
GYKCRGGGTEAPLAPFFLLALRSAPSSFELFTAPTRFLRRLWRTPAGSCPDGPPPPLCQSGATGPRVSTGVLSRRRRRRRRKALLRPFASRGHLHLLPRQWPPLADRGGARTCGRTTSSDWCASAPRSVVTRVPGEETEPTPEPGERVVFGAHLDRGLGLPASTFFRQFLDNFGLQPHHLPANACVLLSCLWRSWRPTPACGRHRLLEPAVLLEGADHRGPPVGLRRRLDLHSARRPDQLELQRPHHGSDAEVNQLWDFLGAAVENGLTAEDLLCTVAERRVLPLQMCTHKIGHMSGRFDPNRTSKAPLSKAQVASRVNNITKANVPDDWNYGLAPRDRDHLPEQAAGGSTIRPFTEQQQEDEEPATSATGPIPAVPLRVRPPSATATSAPKGRKRVGSTAALESKAKKLRRLQPKKVPEQAGAPIKFAQGGGSRQTPRVASPPLRQRREPTPQPSSRAPTPPPPAGTPPPAGAPSPCRWTQRLIVACGPSRRGSRHWTICSRAGLVFRTQPLGPAGHAAFNRSRSRQLCTARDRSRSRQGCAARDRSRSQAERGGAGWEPGGGTSGAGDDCADWAICFAQSAATTGADDGGAGQAGAGKGEQARRRAPTRARW